MSHPGPPQEPPRGPPHEASSHFSAIYHQNEKRSRIRLNMVIKPHMFTIHTPKFRKIDLGLHVEIRNLKHDVEPIMREQRFVPDGSRPILAICNLKHDVKPIMRRPSPHTSQQYDTKMKKHREFVSMWSSVVIKPHMFTIHTPKFRKIDLGLHVEIRNLKHDVEPIMREQRFAPDGTARDVALDTVNFWWLFFFFFCAMKKDNKIYCKSL